MVALDRAQNEERFGRWASPYNHGHNYVLDVETEGPVDSKTGMVVNIKDIDDIVQESICAEFDGRSINDQIPHFANVPATLENMLLYMRDRLAALPKGANLVGLRLEETPTLWANLERIGENWTMTLTRSYEFASSHRLYSPHFSEEENVEMFGKCANPAGHGHNYVVEVTVSGTLNPLTGMMVDLDALDEAINEIVVDRYDHKNLNEDLDEFKGRTTTSENVVQAIWDSLDGRIPAKLEKVRLYETARSVFEVRRA